MSLVLKLLNTYKNFAVQYGPISSSSEDKSNFMVDMHFAMCHRELIVSFVSCWVKWLQKCPECVEKDHFSIYSGIRSNVVRQVQELECEKQSSKNDHNHRVRK
jgi:hypothetical protein